MKRRIKSFLGFLFSRDLKLIELFIILVYLLWGFCRDLQSVEFQPDETFWIASSVRLDRFLSGDFESPVWNEPFVNYEVRPIPSYIVAISQRMGGIKADELSIYWDWALTKDENISRGAMPSNQTLWWSRLPMAVITVFTFLIVIIFLAKAHSRLAAYVFVAISFSDYFLLHLRRAMSEAPLLFFTILVFLASYKLLLVIEEGSISKIILWSAIAGALSGLAGQSKLTGLACTAIPVFAVLAGLFYLTATAQIFRLRTFVTVATVAVFSSLLIFVASYPFFYENTLYRTMGTFYFRNAVIEGQMQLYADQVISSNDRINVLLQRIFAYPITWVSEDIMGAFVSWINLCVTVFGIGYLAKQAWKKESNWEIYLIFLLGWLTCAVPMLFVPFDWDRYYLYPIFFSCIFFSIGFSQLLFLGLSLNKNLSDEK